MNVDFRRGQMISVSQKQNDGKRERVVSFAGKVVKSRGDGVNKMITVRQTIEGIDVDRIFSPFAPHIVNVEEVGETRRKKSSCK